MSRLTDLLRRASTLDPQLGADLDSEFRVLASRRAFGLNFERHQPEAVELPGRPVRKGDKVRILPPRGSVGVGDNRRWKVTKVTKLNGDKVATLRQYSSDGTQEVEVPVDDLVVIAEFRDPIYPGLIPTGSVERGGDKPFHTVINGENFHALQTLLYTHRGNVDCIYIDPPYNSGARDWKYNNNYVENDDHYRHSKWLAFMERRLLLAKELLDPNDSVLIVTIDEKEYLRLGLLLEQVFPGDKIQMTSIVINPKGTARNNEFSRVEEFAFFVFIGDVKIQFGNSDMLTGRNYSNETDVRWRGLARTGRKGLRVNNPGSWYPIFVNTADSKIHSIGETLAQGLSESQVAIPEGTVAVWPPRKDGLEYSWSAVPATLRDIKARGGLKTGKIDFERGSFPFYYLSSGTFEKIALGDIVVTGVGADGELQIEFARGSKSAAPRSVWNQVAHDAGAHGTGLLQKILPGRKFPFPKSLYSVEDALRFFLSTKPDAVVLDFFAGSGTTAHAVMRLNKQDGGRRQSISITNNEVAAADQQQMRLQELRAGDPDWEKFGICEFITKPRIQSCITGLTPDGESIKGDYKFNDEFPMKDGFEENVEFFTLNYNSPTVVGHNRAFSSIAPLLWMRAGSVGRRIDEVPSELGWDVAEAYGVLFNLDNARSFVKVFKGTISDKLAFIVTDDDRRFQMICRTLPGNVQPVRLYESYFLNFEINTGNSS